MTTDLASRTIPPMPLQEVQTQQVVKQGATVGPTTQTIDGVDPEQMAAIVRELKSRRLSEPDRDREALRLLSEIRPWLRLETLVSAAQHAPGRTALFACVSGPAIDSARVSPQGYVISFPPVFSFEAFETIVDDHLRGR
jgi:hypothetical protein